jgi:hypothetical protein
MVKYEGYWSTVRKTVVGDLVDKNGTKFPVRYLVDSGSTVTLMPMHCLYMSRGDWDYCQTPKITMQGINAASICDLMVEAKFIPGDHVTSAFREKTKVPNDFSINLQFHVQKGVEIFKCYKRELPDAVRQKLLSDEFCLADPEQAQEGCDNLYIHGIIGEDVIHEMEETQITKVSEAGMRTTRTYFGDLLHGRSQFIRFPYKTGGLEMKEEQEFAINDICQNSIIPVYLNSSQEDKEEEELRYLQSMGK